MQVKQRAHQKMDFMRNHVRTKVIGPNVPILSLMSESSVVKLYRAQGGCLGTKSR